MPVLNEISGNRQRKPDIPSEKRAQMIQMRDCGYTYKRIAQSFGYSHSTVFSTIKAHRDSNGRTMPRSGAPNVLSDQDKRHVLRNLHREPKITYKRLIDESGLPPNKRRTVRRWLHSIGVDKWRSKRRPLLSEENAAQRLAFANKWLAYNEGIASQIIWTDELLIY